MMDRQRYNDLQDGRAELTQEEIKAGWHFCSEWDYMLVGPGMSERRYCHCFDPLNRVIDWIYRLFGR